MNSKMNTDTHEQNSCILQPSLCSFHTRQIYAKLLIYTLLKIYAPLKKLCALNKSINSTFKSTISLLQSQLQRIQNDFDQSSLQFTNQYAQTNIIYSVNLILQPSPTVNMHGKPYIKKSFRRSNIHQKLTCNSYSSAAYSHSLLFLITLSLNPTAYNLYNKQPQPTPIKAKVSGRIFDFSPTSKTNERISSQPPLNKKPSLPYQTSNIPMDFSPKPYDRIYYKPQPFVTKKLMVPTIDDNHYPHLPTPNTKPFDVDIVECNSL